MNRKILAGAMALALPLSIVGVNAAGAKAKVAKPAITGVSFASQSPTLGFSESSSQIAPYQTAVATFTGTALSAVTADQISGTIKGSGLYALLGKAITVTNVTHPTSTSIVANVEGPTGNSLINSQKKGALPGTLTLTLAGAKQKATASIVSNCGSTLPTIAVAGNTYGTNVDGSLNVAGGTTGTSAGLDYFDVGTLGYNLCADDIGSATSSGTPVFASNYPVQFAKSGSSSSSITGVGFSFPYTTARTLSVTGTSITYQLNNYKQGATCSAGTQANSHINALHVTCMVSSKGLVTVSDTADSLTYSKGDTIVGPVINLTGLVAKGAGHITLTPLGDSSSISIGGIPVQIVFSPRPGTSNATYAALTN
jgi:hypothetical protein